jgi:ABC-type multidrug transport system fused ATPase/permease subunit
MVFIVVLIASFLLQMVLPWWIIVPVSFITCCLIGKTPKKSIWEPFFAIFTLWTGVALSYSLQNQHILAGRVAEMFGLQTWWLILFVTALAGGFIVAISGICGYKFRKTILTKKHVSHSSVNN